MEVQGKIIQKLPLQEGMSKAGNPWKKQVYILETFDSYPKKVLHVIGAACEENPHLHLYLTDSDHLILSPLTPETIAGRMNPRKESLP